MQECPLPSCAFQPTLVADVVAKGGNPWENTDEISKHRPSHFKASSSGGFVAQKKKCDRAKVKKMKLGHLSAPAV